jgi:hypothetical protein
MKKNSFSFTSAAVLLLAVGLVGCSRESANEENGTQTMFLKVTPAETRATTAPVGAVQAAFTGDGMVFFTTSSGIIVRQLVIGTTAYNVGANPNNVNLTELGTGVPITDVPAAAARVYVFGTLPSSTFFTVTVGTTNISACLEEVVTAEELFSAGTVANVPVYGNAPIMPDASNFKADVSVAPAAGRIELAKLTGNAEIKSFTVKAVYVNNYYTQLGIDGTLFSGDVIVNNTNVLLNYSSSTGGAYNGLIAGSVYDNSLTLASASKIVDLAPNVLAYNLMPLKGGTSAVFPHLVIELADIVLVAGDDAVTFSGTKYLTVTGVALNSNPSVKIAFEAGKIYKIADLQFGPGDIAPTPEPLNKQVTVKVTVADWVPVAVVPVLN